MEIDSLIALEPTPLWIVHPFLAARILSLAAWKFIDQPFMELIVIFPLSLSMLAVVEIVIAE